MTGKHILWLVSWYPNPEDNYDGDFIQRHAGAAALHNQVHVHFVKPLANVPARCEMTTQNGFLTEHIIYIQKGHGLFKKFVQQWRWFHKHKVAINSYIKANGKPHCIHVHVPWKTGLVALWAKYAYAIPFVVTEHWGIYNDVVPDRYGTRPFWMKFLFKSIYKQAAQLISPSRYLGNQIQKMVVAKPCIVVPNVVDTTVFYYKPLKNDVFTFVHISNMVPLKNVEGILKAFGQILQTCSSVRLLLVGNRDAYYQNIAQSLQLDESKIQFLGEVPHAAVAVLLQNAHCLVVNSYIENAPCVIGEALCCGVPVIATRVGGIPEMVTDENGILVEAANADALYTAMQHMMQRYHLFDCKSIAAKAAMVYGTTAVSNQFNHLYNNLLPAT